MLALLVLLASSSFFVDVHTCGGMVKGVALLDQADGCGHQALPPCHKKPMKGCCENDQVVHEGLDFKVTETATLNSSLIVSSIIYHNTVVLAQIVPTVTVKPNHFLYEHPPTRMGQDLIISIHSFLI